jgi:deoxycytidylate deaminase
MARGYGVERLHLSSFMNGMTLKSPMPPAGATDYDRINLLMDRGNELRQITGRAEALALLAAAHVNAKRREGQPRHLEGQAFVIRQLKHPDEVLWLRYIYGPAFFLMGIYSPDHVRKDYLTQSMSADDAARLMTRDEGEDADWGQQLRRTFYLSDVFIDYPTLDGEGPLRATAECKRFLGLVFGDRIVTPTRDEYGMYLAHAAALRSADLSRQVGAAILTQNGEVKSMGCNEVPSPGGGQYWEGRAGDARDKTLGYDSNSRVTRDALQEAFERLKCNGAISFEERRKQLRGTRLMNLTEFGRAVHAEMEAILAAGRLGQAVRDCDLYTTTFPCHNCAKHIVGAGLRRVVYVEPYPKSLAKDLHKDSIAFPEERDAGAKTRLEPFVGVAPRAYPSLFSMFTVEGKQLKRKDSDGNLIESSGIRSKASPLSYIDKESVAAIEARKIGEIKIGEE